MVSQGVGGHEGYSGTPLWKIQQQNREQRELLLQESLAYVVERKPIVPPNVMFDAVSIGGPSGKPLTRHVLVKCLRRVAERAKIELPTTGLFQNQAPVGLYALFDGQSSASEPGPGAAEFCARNFHKKVMENFSSLPSNCTSETFVKAALVKSFEDLDKELLETQPDVKDGCGAAVALLLGDFLFTAVLGTCEAVLCEASGDNGGPRANPLGRNQGRCHLPDERARLLRAGGIVVGEGAAARVRGPSGSTSSVSRSLGDPSWKKQGEGTPVLSCIPEIQSIKLSWADRHTFLLLASKPVAEAMPAEELVDVALGFPVQPRAASGEVAAKATEKYETSPQCTVVEIWFLPGGPSGASVEEEAVGGGSGSSTGAAPGAEGPPKKKAKPSGVASTATELSSARLRHILVKFQDGPRPGGEPAGKKARTRQEAEALLRRLMRELRIELEELRRKPNIGKKPEDIALKSEKFAKLCKEHSECPTSQKGGGMCGDLGWMSREAQLKMGGPFRDAVAILRPGDYSDIVASGDGLHLVQRIA